MCGFAGILNSQRLYNIKEVQSIASRVNFRGPDYTGCSVYDENFTNTENGLHSFFVNRLAIFDLDPRSHQPFENERYTLLYNGAIYNYKELKSELEKKGIPFKTTSDTEVLFYILQILGIEGIKKLNGMFAFFFLDKKNRTFILCRDRVGIKPLYYRQENNSFIFGSELHSILRFSSVSPVISPIAIQQYLSLQYIPTPNSIIENIYKLPPGYYISGSVEDLKNGNTLTPLPFWDAYQHIHSHSSMIMNYEQEELEHKLVQSISSQLQADVPVGIFLSSGIDSSLLTALINKYLAKEKVFKFFTVAFREQTDSDESIDAAKYLQAFGNNNLQHYFLEIDQNHLSRTLDSLYNYYDEPFGDPTALLNLVIAEKAKEYVTVTLSGDGGDELFWGYPRYNVWRKRKKEIYRILLGNIKNILPHTNSYSMSRLYKKIENDPLFIYLDSVTSSGFYAIDTRNILLQKSLWYLTNLSLLHTREDFASIIDFKTYLPAMLYKVDRSSMAASLETRVPFLDNEIVNFGLQLALQGKSNTMFPTKAPFKKILQTIAPQYDIHKPKKGFNFPLQQWMSGSWREKIADTITKNNLEKFNVETKSLFNIVENYYKSDCSKYSTEVWRLLNLILWKEKLDSIKNN